MTNKSLSTLNLRKEDNINQPRNVTNLDPSVQPCFYRPHLPLPGDNYTFLYAHVHPCGHRKRRTKPQSLLNGTRRGDLIWMTLFECPVKDPHEKKDLKGSTRESRTLR